MTGGVQSRSKCDTKAEDSCSAAKRKASSTARVLVTADRCFPTPIASLAVLLVHLHLNFSARKVILVFILTHTHTSLRSLEHYYVRTRILGLPRRNGWGLSFYGIWRRINGLRRNILPSSSKGLETPRYWVIASRRFETTHRALETLVYTIRHGVKYRNNVVPSQYAPSRLSVSIRLIRSFRDAVIDCNVCLGLTF